MASGVGFLLEALAALGVGAAGGAAKAKAQETAQQQKLAGDAVMALIQGGQDVPEALGKAAFGGQYKEIGPQLQMLTQGARQRKQAQQDQTMELFKQFVGGGQPGGAPATAQAPGPSAAVQSLIAPQAETAPGPPALPGGISAAPPALAPRQVPQLQPTRSATLSVTPGEASRMSVTATMPSGADQFKLQLDAERAAREAAKFPLEYKKGITELQHTQQTMEHEKAKGEREKVLQQREDAGRSQVQTLMEQSAASQDPEQKRTLFERAAAVAAGAGLKDVETLLKAHTAPPKPEKLDLSKPGVTETVAATGMDPVTRAPVDAATHKAAIDTMKAREARIIRQNEAVAKVATKELGERVAITGTMKGLVKASEAIGEFEKRATQIEGALDTMRKNLDVFPTTITGTLSAKAAVLLQTDRGSTILQLRQAVNLLQGAEPRFLAGEKGRIPQQLENQWREVLADPTRHTKATALKLLASTRQRLDDMRRGLKTDVELVAGTASRLGVAKPLLDAFRANDTAALRLSVEDGTRSGALPPVLTDEDFK